MDIFIAVVKIMEEGLSLSHYCFDDEIPQPQHFNDDVAQNVDGSASDKASDIIKNEIFDPFIDRLLYFLLIIEFLIEQELSGVDGLVGQ